MVLSSDAPASIITPKANRELPSIRLAPTPYPEFSEAPYSSAHPRLEKKGFA